MHEIGPCQGSRRVRRIWPAAATSCGKPAAGSSHVQARKLAMMKGWTEGGGVERRQSGCRWERCEDEQTSWSHRMGLGRSAGARFDVRIKQGDQSNKGRKHRHARIKTNIDSHDASILQTSNHRTNNNDKYKNNNKNDIKLMIINKYKGCKDSRIKGQ